MEPEVADLVRCLQSMGARISGVGTHRLEIEGVDELHGCDYTVIPDRIEAGTFLIAGALLGGRVEVEGAEAEDLMAFLDALNAAGVEVERQGSLLAVEGTKRFRPVDITTHSFPGYPTDLQAQIMVLLALADGISVVTERIYPDRFIHVAELNPRRVVREEGTPFHAVAAPEDVVVLPAPASDRT